jgi:hypothetical protein
MENLRVLGLLCLIIMMLSCEKEGIESGTEVQQKLDSSENYFEGPIPDATVPILDFENSGNDMFKESTGSSLTPDFGATLLPEESHIETLTATINGGPSVGDVMFIMDLTGSMGGELNNAKVNSINIMNAIQSLVPDTNYGLSSHMDYVGAYNYCGYSSWYSGTSSDYPYRLDAALSSDLSAVEAALNGLSLGNGGDGPENYSRPLWELTNDLATGWRSGSKKVAIIWLDNIPHDCNVFELVGINYSSGPDVGRDGVAGTEDDIVFIDALQQLKNKNITLITLYSGFSSLEFNLWNEASKITGGQAYQINTDGTIPSGEDISAYLAGLIAEDLNNIDELTIEVCDPEYDSWLTGVSPSSYSNIILDSPFVDDYDVTITAPAGTPPGVYEFELCLMGDGAEYARSNVVITVPEANNDVSIDIHPGSCPNPLETKRNGVVPVSISGSETFDVNEINVASITLEGVSPILSAIEDVSTPYFIEDMENLDEYDCHTLTEDGYEDLSLKFRSQEILSALGDVETGDVIYLTLTGELNDGTPFSGGDVMIIR